MYPVAPDLGNESGRLFEGHCDDSRLPCQKRFGRLRCREFANQDEESGIALHQYA
jgi:hypothetical protein